MGRGTARRVVEGVLTRSREATKKLKCEGHRPRAPDHRCVMHIANCYKTIVNGWALYDNTGTEPALLEWSENPVKQEDLPKARNPALRGSLAAMRRAAALARETAIQTGTAIVVVRDGKIVRIPAAELRSGRS